MKTMTTLACMAAFAALAASSVRAEDSFRRAVIDPLSGPSATTGEVGLKSCSSWRVRSTQQTASRSEK